MSDASAALKVPGLPESTQSGSVARFVLDRLHNWGCNRIYGYPGDGINGFIGAFRDVGDRVKFTQTRHEEIAAFCASAHAKFSGGFGVCMATSGPGAIHLLNGLYDAKLDHVPVVAIVGQQKRMSIGGHFQQEVDLPVLFSDVAGEYVHYCMEPTQAAHLVDRAVRIALSYRTVTAIIVPEDVQEAEHQDPPRAHGAVFSSGDITNPRVLPQHHDLERAAEILNGGEKVAMLVGQGARAAAEEVKEVAELLGCGVAKALNGIDVLPDDLPYVTGPCGLLGTKPTDEMMENCDTFPMVGSSFPYSEWLPKPGEARGVEINLDPKMIGIRYPMEVNLVGDASETLRALIPLLRRKQDRSWREHLEHEVTRWWEMLADRAQQSADPVNPQLIYHELSPRLPDRVITTADSGSSTNWWARQLKLRDGMRAALSGTLATMAPAVPYALAAKFAHPDRPVIAAIGDGAMQMLGINTLVDIAHYYHQWQNKQLVIIVLNNRDLNQVTWEQRVLAGDPKTPATQDLPDFPYARYAELLGLKGIRVERPDEVAPGLDEALASDRPVVYEAITDPEVPPLPPHIRMEQVKSMTSALAHGEPHAGKIIKESVKGKVQEFVNR